MDDYNLKQQMAALQQAAEANGHAKRLLTRGLAISLTQDVTGRTLRFGRRSPTWPSTDEIAICAKHGLRIEQGYTRRTYERDGYNIIEYAWPSASAGDPGPQIPLAAEIAPLRRVDMPREASLAERFELFHRANPQVYQALCDRAMRLARAGAERIGVKMLYEVLRYDYAVRTRGDEYKLNNSWTSHYARLLDTVPELHGRIELRELRAA